MAALLSCRPFETVIISDWCIEVKQAWYSLDVCFVDGPEGFVLPDGDEEGDGIVDGLDFVSLLAFLARIWRILAATLDLMPGFAGVWRL